jgi:transketolase
MSVARQHPTPMRFVNIGDRFAESGDEKGLLKKYGLTADDIVKAATE